MGISNRILNRYTYNKIFIETGLGMSGVGVSSALALGFEKIYSIEFYPQIIEMAKEKFRNFPQVTLIQGDSGQELGKLLTTIHEPATIWLDAHFDFTVNYVKVYPVPLTDPLPILRELKAIKKHPIKTHTILVDDLIMIKKGHPTWPPIKEKDIRKALQAINPDYDIYYVVGGTQANRKDDILVAEKREGRTEGK